jgi:hypothetical protein
MDYIARFRADLGQFNQRVNEARRNVTEFSQSNQRATEQAGGGFKNLIQSAGKMAAAYLTIDTAVTVFKNAIASTQTTQDAWEIKVNQVNDALEVFYRTLANGDWSNFISNMQKAIELSEGYAIALDNLNTSKLRTSLQTSQIDVDIEKLKAEREKFKEGEDEYTKLNDQINALIDKKNEQTEFVGKQYQAALDSLVKKELINNEADAKRLIEVLDETSDVYKELVANAKKLKDLKEAAKHTETVEGTENVLRQSAKGAEAEEELNALKASPDILVSNADDILEHKTDFKEFIELSKEYNDLQISMYQQIGEQNARARAIADARATAQESALKTEIELRKKLLDLTTKTQAEMEKYDKTTSKQAQRELDNVMFVNHNQYNPIEQKSVVKPNEKKRFEPLNDYAKQAANRDNKFVDQADMSTYNTRVETERQLSEAIAINTELYGAQSEKVTQLQDTYKSMFDPKGIDEFGTAIGGLSSALDILASSSDAIKDNPAIRILASGLMVLAAVQQLMKVKGGWIEYVIAAASLAAAGISFASSMANAKFATGGIVKPAPVGDQTNIRVNEGEMILNHNQQTRLFNLIQAGKNDDNTKKTTEFKNGWIEYAIAAASLASAEMSLASSMKNVKFAVGGIVKPAPIGDQTRVRVNEDEMILNHNQQTRLFNIIQAGKNDDNTKNTVEFRLRGQDLVGLISNYNSKHNV